MSAVDALARRIALYNLPIAIFEALVCLAVWAVLMLGMPRQYGGASVLAMGGLTLIAIAAEVFLGVRLYGSLRKPLYISGALVGRPWPMLAFARLGCVVLVAIGLGLLTPVAVHLGLALAMAAAAVVAWLLLHAATRTALNLGDPVLKLSEHGVWTAARAGDAVPWSGFEDLRCVRTLLSTRWVLIPEAQGAGPEASATLAPAGLDLTHGDLLRAIAAWRPGLLDRHLS